MRQLLRLLTALMLLFGLCQIILAQRRGTTRYISSPDPNVDNWESQKMSRGIMSRADTESNTVQQPRRQRHYGRTTNGRTSTTISSPIETISIDSSTELKSADKVPVYRVRGRNKSKLQITENERIESTTTDKVSTGKPTRRKMYQGKQRTRTEPVSSTISSRDEFEPKTKPNPHMADNHRRTYSNLNRTATDASTRKTTNGRRYRIRVVEGNQGNEITTKITTTTSAATTKTTAGPTSSTTTAANDSKKTVATSPDRDAAIEEQNYPEHFKALLKSKKSPSAPSLSTRSNAFILPKKQIQSSTATKTATTKSATSISTTSPTPTPLHPVYKHKKIERPNLKHHLFPSLYSTAEPAMIISSTADQHDEMITDNYNTEYGINTEPAAPEIPSTTTSKAQISTKHIGGLKFSSKLRSMNFDEQQSPIPIPIHRTRTTPHASTSKDSTQQISNHRYSTLPVLDTPKFSARYKSGEIGSSLAAYRKNSMREKPPFYTPTTPPITTQMNEIDWAASDYSYHYNDVEPVHSGLMQNPPLNVETSHHSSSSVTVSIFGALSEILSHTTESLSFLTSTTTTESTPQSHTHSTFLHSTIEANDNLKPIQKIQSATSKPTNKHTDQTIHIPSTKQQYNELAESIDSHEDLARFKSSTTTTTTSITPSFEHNASNEQSAEQLNEYLRNVNKTDIHTKSKNVFSLAPPSSSVSSISSTNVLDSKVYRPLTLDDYDSLQPSSNEVTSNENQSSSSETADFDTDPFSLDPIVDSSDTKIKPSATSPKSNREYITSFTTTTTTTRKPHIEKGVKIIQELVEQAKITPQPDSDRPIQSLTTIKPMITKVTEKKIIQKSTTTPLPPNHKSEAETISGRTTIYMSHPMLSSTKIMRTSTVATTRATAPVTRSPASIRTTNESPIGINDIEDLSKILKTIQSTTIKKERTTTIATTPKTKTTTDDLNFIRQVQRFLQGTSTTTRIPYQIKMTNVPTTKVTTTRKATPTVTNAPKLEIYPGSKTKSDYDEPTSTFNELLNSFQREPTTTRRPQLTTFSDADDVAFLNGLRQIAISDPNTTTKTTRNPEFTKQIAQLAINRTTSNGNSNANENYYQNNSNNNNKNNINTKRPTIQNEIANIAGVSVDEIEKNQNDVASLNSDLKLLSTLLGRPISDKDLPKLTNNLTTKQTNQKSVFVRTTRPATIQNNPALVHEVDLLQKIIQKQIEPVPAAANELATNNDNDKVLASIDPAEAYGKTNDALLATLLKQRGIGPAHNAIPLNIYSSTTTPRPIFQSPSRSPRPLLDGLRWLWQTWQETAPGNGGYQPQSSRTRTRGLAPNDPNNPNPNQNLQNSETSFDDGLDPDLSSQPLDQSHSNENGGFGFGSGLPGGQLLSTALGMTRAVTQFLGTALQGAGKTLQTAWSTQSFGSASAGGDYFRLSG